MSTWPAPGTSGAGVTASRPGVPDLPRGVTGVHVLPADHHDGPWEAIVAPDGTRERLLGTALVAMLHARRLAALPAATSPSGLIVLAGPPGTGKTTLAQGLAQAAALAVASRGATTLIEIDPHALPTCSGPRTRCSPGWISWRPRGRERSW